MNYLVKIKKFLLRYSKREKSGKQPKIKELSQKTVNFFVYGFISLLFLVGFLGALKSIGLSSQVNYLRKAVLTAEKKVIQKPVTSPLDVARVEYYMTNFIYYYVNYDSAKSDERKEALSKFYSFNTTTSVDEVKKNRVLKNQRLISVTQEKDFNVAYMRAVYEVDNKLYKMTLAIPFQMENGLLAIVNQPHTVAEDMFQGKSKGFEKKELSSIKNLSESDVESLKKFLTVFFDKYALSNRIDLKLLMRQPELMGAGYRVDHVDTETAVFYSLKGSHAVQLSVTFNDLVSGGKRSEDFTLTFSKTDSGWYVEEMYHYFK
ncbi:TPA: conjugal transfer protein [Streptococcus agalactiae]